MLSELAKKKNAAYQRQYRLDHPEYAEAKKEAYKRRMHEDPEFREKHHQYCHRYYIEHRDQIKQKEREWYQANRDHALQKSREQYQRKKAEKNGQ